MSYNYRKDGRTDEQFEKEIDERTKIERRAADSLLDNWLRKKSPQCCLEDHGCGNDGKVRRKGVTQKADFKLLNFGNKDYVLEMKVSPVGCVTLKEDQVNTLTKYGDTKQVYVDWCVDFEKPSEAHYLMTPATTLKMFCTHGRYAAHPGFGGKRGWRLFRDQIDSLAGQYEFIKLTNKVS